MPYKMAIIGFGGMANGHYRHITENVRSLSVKGAYDIRPEAREDIVKKGIVSYGSPEEIYGDNEIDLVLIATQNDVHKPYAIACLNAGKNVVCEKPAVLNRAELEEIYAAAEKNGKFFTVHQNRRWDPDYLAVKKILEKNMLGAPFRIESRVRGSRRYLNNWRSYKQNGGGMILDWGVHLADQMLLIAPGAVVNVDVHSHNVYCKEVDDNFTALFRFDNGLSYIIEVTYHNFIEPVRWNILGENGTAVVENWNLDGKIVKLNPTIKAKTGEEIYYGPDGPVRVKTAMVKESTVELPLPIINADRGAYYRNIVKALGGTEKPFVTPEQALRVMAVIDAMFESAEKGCGIKCRI